MSCDRTNPTAFVDCSAVAATAADALKVGLNESGHIEMEESMGETLSEKLEDFDEVIPNISESEQEVDHPEINGDVVHETKDVEMEVVEVPEVEETQEPLENGVDHSPISNGHSIVTEATIEAHDMTDLEQSGIVSTELLWTFDWNVLCA